MLTAGAAEFHPDHGFSKFSDYQLFKELILFNFP
jgi:hypothetical protein